MRLPRGLSWRRSARWKRSTGVVASDHLSVTVTAVDGQICPTPCFFGAHPASVTCGNTTVLRPLGPEEDSARALLAAMTVLIEYDNTSHQANHVHAVLRRPGDDFGESLLAQHYAVDHTHPSSRTV